MRKRLVAAALAAATMLSTAPAFAESHDLQSVFGLQVPSIGQSPVKWAERVKLMTGGEVDIKVHGAGDFVPGFEVFGAVSSGALPMGFDWIGYWAQTIPVANLVGSMPFGPSPDVALAWMFEGGGMEIIQKAYDPHGVKVIPCHLVVPEAGGWFNKEINSVDDFKGLNMRIAGLGGKALAKLGANTQLVPAGEIYVSLETGRIDATEFSAPQLDIGLGFQKVAKYYYFPGWHQPATIYDLMINLDSWKALSPAQQAMVQSVCGDNVRQAIAMGESMQADSLDFFKSKGVEIRQWSPEILSALEKSWEKVAAQESEKNADFKETWESMQAFRKRYKTWLDIGYLKR